MALKEYEVNGLTFQYEEGKQPKGAKPVTKKAAAPARNKGRKPADKTGVEDATDPDASE